MGKEAGRPSGRSLGVWMLLLLLLRVVAGDVMRYVRIRRPTSRLLEVGVWVDTLGNRRRREPRVLLRGRRCVNAPIQRIPRRVASREWLVGQDLSLPVVVTRSTWKESHVGVAEALVKVWEQTELERVALRGTSLRCRGRVGEGGSARGDECCSAPFGGRGRGLVMRVLRVGPRWRRGSKASTGRDRRGLTLDGGHRSAQRSLTVGRGRRRSTAFPRLTVGAIVSSLTRELALAVPDSRHLDPRSAEDRDRIPVKIDITVSREANGMSPSRGADTHLARPIPKNTRSDASIAPSSFMMDDSAACASFPRVDQ